MQLLHISIKSILPQNLRKYHLLLIVHSGTSACVHRLLQLFSVSFGFSTSQLKVHFLAFRAAAALCFQNVQQSSGQQLLCLSELMQCLCVQMSFKNKMECSEKRFNLQVTPIIWLFCCQFSEGCFSSPYNFHFIQLGRAVPEILL